MICPVELASEMSAFATDVASAAPDKYPPCEPALGPVIENEVLDFVTGRCGRGPLFSRGWIGFYSTAVSIRGHGRVGNAESPAGRMACAGEPAVKVQNSSDEHQEHKAGSDGTLPLRPAFLYRAEFDLFCHASKLAEERKRSSASPCGLFWTPEAGGLRRLET